MFGERLRKLRKENGLVQEDLAKLLKVSPSTIGMYEQGRRDPDTGTLQKIANYFNVSTDYLLGREQLPSNAWPVDAMKQIPILGVIRCGEPIYAKQNIERYEWIPEEEVKGGEYFYLRVTGDSMIGSRIYPGDKVLIRRQEQVENGEIAVVMVDREEATLKRVKYMEEAIFLYPDNPNYEVKVYKAEDVRIIGIVTKVVFDPNKKK